MRGVPDRGVRVECLAGLKAPQSLEQTMAILPLTRVAAFGLVFVALACRRELGVHDTFTLRVSPEGVVRLDARGASVRDILASLGTDFGVQVTVPEMRDTTVTVTLDGTSLDSVLSVVLPAGLHGWVSIRTAGERELIGNRADKRGRKVGAVALLPRKGDRISGPIDARLPAKPVADTMSRSLGRQGTGGSKPAAAQVARILPGTGPKVARQGGAVREQHLRLTLTIRDSTITVDDVRVLDGPRVISTTPAGAYYYVIFAGNRPIAIESFNDPFTQHAYNPKPDGPHRELMQRTGRVVATVPLDAATLSAAGTWRVQVLRLRAGATSPLVSLSGYDVVARNTTAIAASTDDLDKAVRVVLRQRR